MMVAIDSNVTISVHDDARAVEVGIIDSGLDTANTAAAPMHEVRPLTCIARDQHGSVVGGAVGRTWGSCCELQMLWVSPAQRRRGIGAEVVTALEQRAHERGCRTFYLETYSFQAPNLYRSLGYEVRLELRGFAPGIVKYTMVKELDVR